MQQRPELNYTRALAEVDSAHAPRERDVDPVLLAPYPDEDGVVVEELGWRVLPADATPDCGEQLKAPRSLTRALRSRAHCEYSWMRPPSRSRRRTRIPVMSPGGCSRLMSGLCCRVRNTLVAVR